MKKMVIGILLLVLCLLCFSALAEQDGLYTYELNDDMTVTITGFDWSNNHGDIYIPEMLGNRMVSAIGNEAFATSRNDAVSITLPEGIKSIGDFAFRGVAIKYINIPLNTTVIGEGAFCQCSVMQFRVAEGHQVFATIDNALYNKPEKMLIAWPLNKEIEPIPNGIKAIGGYVFYKRSITDTFDTPFFPDTLTSIGQYAFYNASYHGRFNKVKEIGDYAFCSIEGYGSSTIYITDGELSLSKIGAHAFENCKIDLFYHKIIKDGNKKYIVFNSTPYEVGDYAFYHCQLYSSYGAYRSKNGAMISLKNVTYIGDYAFAVECAFFDDGSTYVHDKDTIIRLFPDDFDSLTHLGTNAFFCRSTKGSLFISKVNTIPVSAFETYAEPNSIYGYELLESVVLSESVTKISEKAFKGQAKMTDVALNNGILSIGSEAFMGCRGLTEVCIPASVTYIGEDVFAECSDKLVIVVEAGSYGEVWARTCGYSYRINGKADDTSWLDDDSWLNDDTTTVETSAPSAPESYEPTPEPNPFG